MDGQKIEKSESSDFPKKIIIIIIPVIGVFYLSIFLGCLLLYIIVQYDQPPTDGDYVARETPGHPMSSPKR